MKCKHCPRKAVTCGLCRRCYQYVWHAMKRGVRWCAERRENIDRHARILDETTAPHGVVHIRRRRAA